MALKDKVIVRLTAPQREALYRIVRGGSHPAALLRRARILLKVDADGPDAWPDSRVAEALEVSSATVRQVRKQFVAEGLINSPQQTCCAAKRLPCLRAAGLLRAASEKNIAWPAT